MTGRKRGWVFHLVIEMFSYPFMVRALLVGALIALCAAVLGVTLVLKRYSMIGDGLSHVEFGALAIASAMNAAPLLVAIPVVVAAAFFLCDCVRRKATSRETRDRAGLHGSLAVGVMVVSMTTGMNTDVYNYLFGSILSMSGGDVWMLSSCPWSCWPCLPFFITAFCGYFFNENFTQATGIPAATHNSQVSLTDRSCDRDRLAHDGIIADFQPGRFSGNDIDASVPDFPRRRDQLGHRLRRLPRFWDL